MKDERPEFPWHLPPGLRTLIRKCWSKDPAVRPTFDVLASQLERLRRRMEGIEFGSDTDLVADEAPNDSQDDIQLDEIETQAYAEICVE